jgi:hypothetical protein
VRGCNLLDGFAARAMFKALSKMLGGKQQERIKEFHDPVLGTLRLTEEEWWEASVSINGKTIRFHIGGDAEPNDGLVAQAHDIIRTFADFERMVTAFLIEEGHRMRMTSDQIRQLAIEDVMLCCPDRPNDGMIYFSGLDKIGVWRCDYVYRKPRGLGFDS